MKRVFAVLLLLTMALVAIPAQAEAEPVTVKFWHHRGSGAQYECVTQAVNSFNETIGKEKGIVVEETYIGNYVDLFTQLQLSVQSGDAPNVCSAANTYVAYMLEDDMLVDMAALAEAEDYDIFSNQQEWQLSIGGNTDGEIHSVGYCRSCPLFYYNKAIAAELGIEIGATITIDELVKFGEAAMKKDETGATTRYGFTMFNDFGYYNAAFIYQLGSEYIGPEGSEQPKCLTDGTMLKVLTDWRSWVDAGWCMPFPATDPGAVAQSMFVEGSLAAYMNSCAGLGDLSRLCNEAGIELGVASMPTYDADNPVSMIGGANIAIIGCDNTEEEIQASWEFIKFILEDEQQYFNAKTSGYFACTKSVAEYDKMVEFWAEAPEFKVAYDAAGTSGHAQENPYNSIMQDYTQIIWDNVSLLIGEQSVTPEEALEGIIADSADLWG